MESKEHDGNHDCGTDHKCSYDCDFCLKSKASKPGTVLTLQVPQWGNIFWEKMFYTHLHLIRGKFEINKSLSCLYLLDLY